MLALVLACASLSEKSASVEADSADVRVSPAGCTAYRETDLGPDGTIDSRYVEQYDADGRLVMSSWVDEGCTSIVTYEYDSADCLIRWRMAFHDEESDVEWEEDYTCDEQAEWVTLDALVLEREADGEITMNDHDSYTRASIYDDAGHVTADTVNEVVDGVAGVTLTDTFTWEGDMLVAQSARSVAGSAFATFDETWVTLADGGVRSEQTDPSMGTVTWVHESHLDELGREAMVRWDRTRQGEWDYVNTYTYIDDDWLADAGDEERTDRGSGNPDEDIAWSCP